MPRSSSPQATALFLAVLMAFGFFLRFRAADHDYISSWDEAYHALVAKNLTRHPLKPTLYEDTVIPTDNLGWTTAHIWLHKPPLPLWLMAGGIATFGENELSFRLPSVFLDTIVILLVYLLAGELFGKTQRLAGLFAAALYAVNPLMIRLVSGRIPDDAPHVINVFFITCTALLFAVSARKNSRSLAAAAGLSLGLGTLCMSAVALLGLAASLPVVFSMRGVRGAFRLLAVAALAFAAAALPWPLYCLRHWPLEWKYESALQVKHLFIALDGHAHPAWWFLRLLPVHYGGNRFVVFGSVLLCVLFAARAAVRDRSAGLTAALVWAALPYLFFSLIATKLYSYVCVAVPALSLLLGYGAASLWTARRGPLRPVFTAALLIWGVQTAAVARERLMADYRLSPWNDFYDYPSFRRAMLEIRADTSPKVIFNVRDSKAAQAMYYAGASAYEQTPTVDVLRSLADRGYRIYFVIHDQKLTAEFLPALQAAGLAGKVRLVPLPNPRENRPKHPYEA